MRNNKNVLVAHEFSYLFNTKLWNSINFPSLKARKPKKSIFIRNQILNNKIVFHCLFEQKCGKKQTIQWINFSYPKK